jgi:hypothetical protein
MGDDFMIIRFTAFFGVRMGIRIRVKLGVWYGLCYIFRCDSLVFEWMGYFCMLNIT